MEKSPSRTDEPDLQSAKSILQAFIATYKKLSFYSATHTVYREALGPFHKLLSDHIERYGDIRIGVERDRYLFDGTVIHESKAEPTDLLFILHRDGIIWIEFRAGLELWEIDTLLKTCNDYSSLEEDAEDDIVTVLWGFRLPSIAYEAVDLELGLNDDIDFDALQMSPPVDEETAESRTQKTSDGTMSVSQETSLPALPDFEGQDELFHLSPEERKQLEAMIAAERILDGSDYAVDVLLYIIAQHPLVEDVDDLIADLTQAMRDALLNLRFSYLYVSLKKILKQIDIFKSASHWSVPHLESFVSSLSTESFFSDLLSIETQIKATAPDNRRDLKKFLSLLDPKVIYTLAKLMTQSRSDQLQRLLLETITIQAQRDFRPLERLIFESDRVLAGHLIFILRFFSDDHSLQLLFKLLRDDSESIRKQALKTLFVRDVQSVEKLFILMDDTDKDIRSLLLDYLGRERNKKVEKLLLTYLKSGPARGKDPGQFNEVCRTLGRCASDNSLPYLKKLLFKWQGLGILRSARSVQRAGAVTALKELNTPEAAKLVSRISQGFFKNFFRPA